MALCATAFAVPAFAGGGEGEPYYTETEADLTEDDGTPEITVSDDEDTAGGDNAEAGGDTLNQLTELLGSLGTVTVTEDGILFTPNLEGLEPLRTGTVTTCGGNLNVRTGAGLDNDAFTQLPDWGAGRSHRHRGRMGQGASAGAGGLCSFRLPDHHGTTGSFSLSLDGTDLSALLELFASGLSGGGGAAADPRMGQPVPH